MMDKVTVVGAGLAGCEAAWQLVKRKIPVRLVEMRPKTSSPAHHSENFAELVKCPVCHMGGLTDFTDTGTFKTIFQKMLFLYRFMQSRPMILRFSPRIAIVVDFSGSPFLFVLK